MDQSSRIQRRISSSGIFLGRSSPLAFLLLLLCFIATSSSILPVAADNYYLSADGSNSNNGTSPLDAWATLDYAMSATPTGSLLHIGAGTFTLSWRLIPTFDVVGSGPELTTIILPSAGNTGFMSGVQSPNWPLTMQNFSIKALAPTGTNTYPVFLCTGFSGTLASLTLIDIHAEVSNTPLITAQDCVNLTISQFHATGSSQVGLNVVEVDHNSHGYFDNCVFDKLTGFWSAIYVASTTVDPAHAVVTNSAFTNFSNPGGTGSIKFAANSGGEVDHCLFEDNLADYGASMFVDSANSVSITNSYFRDNVGSTTAGGIQARLSAEIFLQNNTFIGNTALYGAGAWLSAASLNVYDNSFFNNLAYYEGGHLATSLSVEVNVVNNLFFGGESTYGGGLLVYDCSSSLIFNNTFTQNSAYNGSAILGAADIAPFFVNMTNNLIFENELIRYADQSFIANVYLAGLNSDTSSAYIRGNVMTDTSTSYAAFTGLLGVDISVGELLLAGMDVELLGNTLTTPIPSHSGLAMENCTATISTDPYYFSAASVGAPSSPLISGMLLLASNVTLATDLDLADGSSLLSLLSLDISMTQNHISTVNLAGFRLSLSDPLLNWFQGITFLNGPLVVNSGFSILCCSDSGGYPLDMMAINFKNASLQFTSSAEVKFYTSFIPLVFDSDSWFQLSSGSFMIANMVNTSSIIVPNLVIDDAVLQASDLSIYGNITLQNSGYLQLYPSYWNNVNHSLNVVGNIRTATGGWIDVSDDQALSPYTPVATLDSPHSAFLIISNGVIDSVYTPFVSSDYLYYEILEENLSAGKIIYSGAPRLLQPLTYADDSHQYLNMYFALPYNRSIPQDCSGFIDLSNNPALDIPSLVCAQQSSTHVIVSSAVLPTAPNYVNMDPSNQLIHTWPFPPRPPVFPIGPVPLIQPIGDNTICGFVALDASHTSGVGSFPANFYWTLENTTDLAHESALRSLLATLPTGSASIVELPVSELTVGASYTFGLVVKNWYDQTSDKVYVSFTSNASIKMPPLILDGPSVRQYYYGVDVVITGIVNASNCVWESNLVTFQWFSASDANATTLSALSLPTATSPSLLLTSSYFGTSIETYYFVLRAYPSPSLGLGDVWTEISVQLIHGVRPLVAASTSASSFVVNETINLSVQAQNYDGGGVLIHWVLKSCPQPFILGLLSVQNVSHNIFNWNPGLTPYDCVSPSANIPFIFPFLSTQGPAISISGNLDPGNYAVTAHVFSATIYSSFVDVVIPFTVTFSSSSAPVVSISLPSLDAHLNTEKLVLRATVNNLTGVAAESAYSFFWSLTFGDAVIPDSRNGYSTLVLPYDLLVSNKNVFVSVSVWPTSSPELVGDASIEVPMASSPSGGFIGIYPLTGISSNTTFTVSANQWSTPFWPLRFIFSYLRPDGVEIGLMESSYQSRFGGFVLETGSDVGGQVQVQVIARVIDGLGAMTRVSKNVTLTAPVPTVLSASSFSEWETSVNASNWRFMNSVLSSMNATGLDAAQRSVLIQGMASLAADSVALIPENVGMILSQTNDNMVKVELTDAQNFDAMVGVLGALVASNTTSFGTTSVFSQMASNQFISTMANLLASHQSSWTTSSNPVSVLSSHGLLLLSSMLEAEPPFVSSSNGLGVKSCQAQTSGLTKLEVQIDENAPSVSVAVSDLTAHLNGGYIGYHFVHYAGIFPYLGTNGGFRDVVDLELLPTGPSAQKRVSQISVTRQALFNISAVSLPTSSDKGTCATYDTSTSSWDASGCTQMDLGEGRISCSCTTLGPLSVLFDTTPVGGNGSGKWWIPLVVVLTVVPALALAIAVVAVKVPAAQRIFLPFRRGGQRLASGNLEMTPRATWKPASTPNPQ